MIRFQGQVVTVNVSNNIIEMITENDEKLVFEANKNNFSIDYNVGNLGSAVCFDENEKFIPCHAYDAKVCLRNDKQD